MEMEYLTSTIWVLLGTVLVFFMQAGFAMVETGFTRAKNAGNIIMKNIMDLSIGALVFWFIGFGIMFGDANPIFGGFDFFIGRGYEHLELEVPLLAFVMFQTVFCATVATIVSGAMAERTKFSSYCIYSLVISAIIYPVSGNWIWSATGWLGELGFVDFAGSTVVHMVGGIAAFVGAKTLGPRIGKYDKDGKAKAIPGHSLTLGALGVFILWFGWFGFNGGSTLGMGGEGAALEASSVFMTTNLAAATATVTVMLLTWWKYKKPDVSMTLNGALAGLVAITAGCASVSPFGAFFIGLIGGVVVVFGVEFIEKVCKVDDPVGAVAVHGLCGAAGTIAVGLFAVDGGLFYGGGVSLLGVQILGVVAVAIWAYVTTTILFKVIASTVGLRVSKEEEIKGLDIEEHGLVSSYADFVATPMMEAAVSLDQAVPVTYKSEKIQQVSTEPTDPTDGVLDVKMTKLSIITRQSKFEELKTALDSIGVTGMTVTQVLGCGMQKGAPEYYRGVAVESSLLPKVKVEVVVCKIPVETLLPVIKEALYTGSVGDGKIFVYDVENVIKVRTGEEGYDALQDEE